MQITLEGFTPYDRSVQWRLHDAYFAQRGIDAWQKGEIPHHSTNNYAVARQHAELLVALVAEREAAGTLAPGDPVTVMEVGGGLGRFAANVLRALDAGCGDAGAALARRLRYVFSDYSARSLREAAATRHLAPLVAAGRVVPALYDLLAPDRLQTLDGAPLDAPLTAVLANYVACVLRSAHFQKRTDGFYALHVEVRADTDEPDADPAALLEAFLADAARFNLLRNLAFLFEWRPVSLAEALPGPLHARVVERVLDGLEEATLGYPVAFVDFLLGVRPLLAPGGLVVVDDYGNVRPEDLVGLRERRPQHYGNSLNHDIHFGVFDAFAAEAGWTCARTGDPLASVHTAILRPDGPLGPALTEGFARSHLQRSDGDDVLDFTHTAHRALEARDYGRAVRYFRRALALDADNPELCYQLGSAYLEAGQFPLAVEVLDRGLALAGDDRTLDFEFQLGRAWCMRGDLDAAVRWYEASLTREQHPVTYTNLAVIHESEGRYEEALLALERALGLDSENKRAQERMEHLKKTWWQTLVDAAHRRAAAPPEGGDG